MANLSLNELFEQYRIPNNKNSIRPFSVLTIGAIYKIVRFDLHYSILTVIRAGEEERTSIQVWAPSTLLENLNLYCSSHLVHIRPTGVHTNIDNKEQYYTYELSNYQ